MPEPKDGIRSRLDGSGGRHERGNAKTGVGLILPSDRRGLLSRVGAAATVALGGALARVIAPSRAWAQSYTGLTDTDQGASQDQAGYGTSGDGYTGISDNDQGANQDQAGYGTGSGTGSAYTGITDNDKGATQDAEGYGRGDGYTGITDNDKGANQDAEGYGQGG